MDETLTLEDATTAINVIPPVWRFSVEAYFEAAPSLQIYERTPVSTGEIPGKVTSTSKAATGRSCHVAYNCRPY